MSILVAHDLQKLMVSPPRRGCVDIGELNDVVNEVVNESCGQMLVLESMKEEVKHQG